MDACSNENEIGNKLESFWLNPFSIASYYCGRRRNYYLSERLQLLCARDLYRTKYSSPILQFSVSD